MGQGFLISKHEANSGMAKQDISMFHTHEIGMAFC
jgi:hypothetical protein